MAGKDNLDIAYGVEMDARGGWIAWAKVRMGDEPRRRHECATRWGAQWKSRRMAKALKVALNKERGNAW